MATVQLKKLLPTLQPMVPGCPETELLRYLAEAAAEFCAVSEVWRSGLDEVDTEVGTALYEIDVPTGSKLENILWVTLDGNELYRVSDTAVPPRVSMSSGTPTRYAIFNDENIVLYPTPDKAYTLKITAILKPALTAKSIESFLYETYGRVIAHGAAGKLLSIPDKQWTNPDLAAAGFSSFHRGIAEARIRDFRSVPMRVTPRPFA